MNRGFKGIWIPREIWLNERLSIQAKALWAEIDSLHDDEQGGCFAPDEYLMTFLGLKLSRLHEVLKELKVTGYLEVINFNGRTRVMRAILPKKQAISSEGRVPENRKAGVRKTGSPSYYRENSLAKKKHTKKSAEAPKPSANASGTNPSAVATELACVFSSNNEKNKKGTKKPDLAKWACEIDEMLAEDKRCPNRTREILDFVAVHDFWKTRILRPKNLRDNWDMIDGQMNIPIPEKVEKHLNEKWTKKFIKECPNYASEVGIDSKGVMHKNKPGKDLSFHMQHSIYKERFCELFEVEIDEEGDEDES